MDAGSCLDRITTFLGVLLDDFQHLSPFQILGTRNLGVFFWGKFRKFEALEALEPLEPVRWGLKFDVQWRLSETWRPDSKLKKWWQGEMSRPHEPTRKGYGVLPEQKWILRILNASQTQQMSVFHFHQPFLKIFLGETHQALPFPSFPPDEHLETPDEPQHLPEADAVFTGEAHFLGHLLDFLLRKLAEIKFQDTSVYGEFLVSLWWVCEVDENETPEKHTLPWWMVMQRPRPSQMPPRWWGIRGASSLVAPGTDRWSMTIPSATSEYFWIVDDWLVVYLPLWKIWKSVGMMKFPYIYMEKYKENVPNHQPVMNVDDILRIYVEYWSLSVRYLTLEYLEMCQQKAPELWF